MMEPYVMYNPINLTAFSDLFIKMFPSIKRIVTHSNDGFKIVDNALLRLFTIFDVDADSVIHKEELYEGLISISNGTPYLPLSKTRI